MGWFSDLWDGVKDSVGNFLTDDVIGGTMDLVGGVLGNNSSEKINATNANLTQQQINYQKELHKNQLQWRVEDAKKAGLHPLAGLGVSSASYSPVSTDLIPADYSFLSDMGQNLNRAIQQGKTQKQRDQALARQNQYDDIMMRKANAEADLAETTAASERLRLHRELFPPSPPANRGNGLIEGQGDTVKYVPDEVISSGPSNSVTAGTHPLWTHGRSGDFVVPVLSDKLADAVTENKEKNIGAEIAYALSAWNGSVKPPANAFTALEKKRLKSGEYKAYYYPLLGWRVEPALSWKNFKKFVLGGYRNQ